MNSYSRNNSMQKTAWVELYPCRFLMGKAGKCSNSVVAQTHCATMTTGLFCDYLPIYLAICHLVKCVKERISRERKD